MSQNVGLSLYRNFAQPHRGQIDPRADENEQARFAKGVGGKKELTSRDVSGTNSKFGRGLERFGRAVGATLGFLKRVFTFGLSQPVRKNWEVRQAFKNAIVTHLTHNSSYSPTTDTGLEADLPKDILNAFKGELNSNKPLTKRRIRAVLAEVDKYVADHPKKQPDPQLLKTESKSKTAKTEIKETKPTRSVEVIKQEIAEQTDHVNKLKTQLDPYEDRIKQYKISIDDPKADWSQVTDTRLKLIGQDYLVANDKLRVLNNELQEAEAPQPKVEEKKVEEPKVEEKKPEENKIELKNASENIIKSQPPKMQQEIKGVVNTISKEVPIHQSGVSEADYLRERDSKVRDLIKRYLPDLENKLRNLRQKMLNLLNIDKDLEGWFDAEMPQLNSSSDSFLTAVVAAIKDKTNQSKTFNELEEDILKRCSVKDDINFEKTNQKDKAGATTSAIIFLDQIAPENEKLQPLTLADYEKFLNANYIGKGYRIKASTNTPIKTMLSQVHAMKDVNAAFQKFVSNPDIRKEIDFENIVNEVVPRGVKGTGKSFGFQEFERIKEMLNETIIEPLKIAKNIWDVKPLAFSRHLAEMIFARKENGGIDIKGCVAEVVKTLAKEFVMNPPKEGNGRVPLDFSKRIGFDMAKKLSAKELIEKAIQDQTGIVQVGAVNCFMVSIVNGLLSTKVGQKILDDCFCKKDNVYTFKDRDNKPFEITQDEVDKILLPHASKTKSMSPLEQVVWAAYIKQTPDDIRVFNPGSQCEMLEFAFLFGLEQDSKEPANVGVRLPEDLFPTLVGAYNHLGEGQIAIVHTGSPVGGHYQAISDVNPGVRNGDLTCFESVYDAEKEQMGAENHLRGKALEGDSAGFGAQIFKLVPKDQPLEVGG